MTRKNMKSDSKQTKKLNPANVFITLCILIMFFSILSQSGLCVSGSGFTDPTSTIATINIQTQVSDPRPTIRVEFTKAVVELQAKLYLSGTNSEVALNTLNHSDDNTVFKFQPTVPLTDGQTYKFVIQGKDYLNNYGVLKDYDFQVAVSPILVYLVNPLYGASNTQVFNLRIGTDRPAEGCRFFAAGSYTYDELPATTNGFSKITVPEIDNPVFELANFDKAKTFADGGYTLNVICKDIYGYINDANPRIITVFYDPTPPVILQTYAKPAIVVEGKQVTLFADTDDQTLCKYGTSATTYDSMTNYFGPFRTDNTSKADFSMNHSITLQLNDSDDKKTFSYNVICMNRATDKSQAKQVAYSVNWGAPGDITAIGPSGVLSNLTITITASTNKKASCSLSNGYPLATVDNYEHARQVTVDSDGNYTVTIRCVFNIDNTNASKTTSFIVDTQPPVMDFVNNFQPGGTPGYTCDALFSGTWGAHDAGSGVDSYSFNIVNVDNNSYIASWASTNNNYTVVNQLSLLAGTKYSFVVKAIDQGGKESLEMQGDPVVADHSKCTALALNCSNSLLDYGFETDVDCGASCIKKCGKDKKCLLDNDCESDNCDKSAPINGYGVCGLPLCQDGIRDGSETDVDCGGSCGFCEDGNKCQVSSDCKSDSCTDGICGAPSCTDKIRNGDETDVDCGGSCPSCEMHICGAADGVCVVNCNPVDPACLSSEITGGTCTVDRICVLNCTTKDLDCRSGNPTCSAGDGCVAGCGTPDPDCGDITDPTELCQAGNVCAVNCLSKDPDCPAAENDTSITGHTCELGDGCNPLCPTPDADCGGFTCDRSNACVNGCQPPDPDCGPLCKMNLDCQTGVCANNRCANPFCNDNIRDGTETGVDCGGNVCSVCDNGISCLLNSDCKSQYCDSSTNKCADKKIGASCLAGDGCKNGCTPTDPDCATGKKTNWLLIILIIFLMLIIAGGVAYYYLFYLKDKKNKQPLQPLKPLTAPFLQNVQKQGGQPQDKLKLQKDHIKYVESLKQRHKENFGLFSVFGGQAQSAAKADKTSDAVGVGAKSESAGQKATSTAKNSAIEKLSALNSGNAPSSAKESKSIFERLTTITTKRGMNKEGLDKIEDKLKGRKEDIFNKLASVTGSGKKKQLKESESGKSPLSKKHVAETKESSNSVSSKKDQKDKKDLEIFNKLSEVSGKKIASEFSEIVSSKPNKDEIMRVLSKISAGKNRKEAKDIFEELLVYLIKLKKISKKDVLDVLTELSMNSTLSEKEVSDLIFEISKRTET